MESEGGVWLWFWVWLKIGMQSFGGGVTTLTLIRQEIVDRRKWSTEEDFVNAWALCQLAPGINLVALAILLGRRHSGTMGIAAAMFGLVAPSALATAGITAIYTSVKSAPPVTAALRCVMPAVVGLGIATSIQTCLPALTKSSSEGRISLTVGVLLLVLPAVAVGVFHLPTLVALLVGSALGAVWMMIYASGKRRTA